MNTDRPPIDVRLRGEDSEGRLAVIETVVPAGFGGPPLHLHPEFDEGFYVLEGELTYQLGDDLITAGPGSFAFAQRGTAHTFANLSGEQARHLILCSPAGFERYFMRMAAEHAGVKPPPEAEGPLPETRNVGPRIGA
jgi:quercetin dioxygenase-like cupin family protein